MSLADSPAGGELVVQSTNSNGNHNGGAIVVQHFDDGDELPARNSAAAALTKFEYVTQMARMLAHSSFVPAHLVDADPLRTQANCFRVALQADKWGRSVFDVADRTYMMKGKLGYEGKLITSVLNTRAGLVSRLQYDYEGAGDDRTIHISGQFRNEATPRTITLSVRQAKNGNEMWTKDPDQKLAYVGALRWARRHCPEVIDGVFDEDDLDAMAEQEVPAAVDHAAKEAERLANIRKNNEAMRAAAEAAKAAVKVESTLSSPASQGTAKPTTTTAPATTAKPTAEKAEAPDPNATLVSATAKAELIALYKSSDLTEAEFDEFLAKCNAEKLSCLTVAQAAQFKGDLLQRQPNAMTNARTEQPTATAPAAKSAPIAVPSPVVVEKPGEVPADKETGLYTMASSISKSQHARIAELTTKLLPAAAWPNADRKDFLAKHKAANFASLSNYVAHHLIAELEKRLAGGKESAA